MAIRQITLDVASTNSNFLGLVDAITSNLPDGTLATVLGDQFPGDVGARNYRLDKAATQIQDPSWIAAFDGGFWIPVPCGCCSCGGHSGGGPSGPGGGSSNPTILSPDTAGWELSVDNTGALLATNLFPPGPGPQFPPVIAVSPDNNEWQVTVDNSGAIGSTLVGPSGGPTPPQILQSPDGTDYQINVDNSGNLSTSVF